MKPTQSTLPHRQRLLTFPASMTATDFGLNGFPRSFRKSRAASSAETARRLIFPPLGFLRANRFASARASGLTSARLFLPSHLPVARRFRYPRRRQLGHDSRFLELRDGPSTCRIRTAVGASSMKNDGALAAIRVIPFALSMSWPAS